jgi:DMSO reductase anchor subunit
VSTTASAIGLADLGRVRLLDPPHTEENYLQKEMGYQIARKHAVKLRGIAMMLGGALPIALIFLTFATSGALAAVLAFLALAAALAGALLERWLFFAEATHRVMLYYGADTA